MPREYSMHAEQGVQPGALLNVCLAGGVQGLRDHRTRDCAAGLSHSNPSSNSSSLCVARYFTVGQNMVGTAASSNSKKNSKKNKHNKASKTVVAVAVEVAAPAVEVMMHRTV